MKTFSTRKHTPILVGEICHYIPYDSRIIVDGTAGHGGHVRAMYEYAHQHCPHFHSLYGIDKDPTMIERLNEQKKLGDWSDNVFFDICTYDKLSSLLQKQNILGMVDFLLLDIGINREHIADPERGFSIKKNGPLDMRFNPTKGKTARELLMYITPEQLAQYFHIYGDFTNARAEQISMHIIHSRRKNGLKTTNDLKELLKALGLNDGKCAVVFQVVRIVVNDELGHLERFLQLFPKWLRAGGRCAIITFHSVEDRMVKRAFKELDQGGKMKLVNKKVIQPSWQEKEKNKASRSAKLRIIEK